MISTISASEWMGEWVESSAKKENKCEIENSHDSEHNSLFLFPRSERHYVQVVYCC